MLAQRDPGSLPWRDLGVDIVVESTGRFVDRASAGKHIEAGARKVVITAPAKDPDVTLVLGVNEQAYDPAKHHVVSNASCTTNCLATVAKVLVDRFGIRRGYCTTVHAYTNDQNIQDFPHKDLRRARAGALSMIPTTTGAAKAVGLVLPSLKGKLDGIAIRVPTPNVSVVDLTAELERPASVESVNEAFRAAAAGPLKGLLGLHGRAPRCRSTSTATRTPPSWTGRRRRWSDGALVKVLAWYDNEWGYSSRVRDLVAFMGRSR